MHSALCLGYPNLAPFGPCVDFDGCVIGSGSHLAGGDVLMGYCFIGIACALFFGMVWHMVDGDHSMFLDVLAVMIFRPTGSLARVVSRLMCVERS